MVMVLHCEVLRSHSPAGLVSRYDPYQMWRIVRTTISTRARFVPPTTVHRPSPPMTSESMPASSLVNTCWTSSRLTRWLAMCSVFPHPNRIRVHLPPVLVYIQRMYLPDARSVFLSQSFPGINVW